MTCSIIDFQSFVDDSFLEEEESNLLAIEELIEDKQALLHLEEEAFAILVSGINHRKQSIRIKVVSLLLEIFPKEETFTLLYKILSDKNQKPSFRFYIARLMINKRFKGHEETIQELLSSKGCNDRICAMILMGKIKKQSHMFYLLNSLEDSNGCVKVAAFLSLMEYSHSSLFLPIRSFLENAKPLELKLLQKNIHYYQTSFHYGLITELLEVKLKTLRVEKIQFHPNFYEKSYSQQKLSKLDRIHSTSSVSQEKDLILFEI